MSDADPPWFGIGASSQSGSHTLLRVINERLVLDRLRACGTQSRADLAGLTGLSKPTIASALANLESYGLVRKSGESSGHAGPAAFLYKANRTAGYAGAIDIGRSWIRVAITDLAGTILARGEAPNRARSAPSLVASLGELAQTTALQAGLDWGAVTSTVIGSPGVFDPVHERVLYAQALPGWGRRGLVAELRQALGHGVVIENDINLAAVGEHHFGAAQGFSNVVLMSIGTGVGLGILINGQLYRGHQGGAGEIGFVPLLGFVATQEPLLQGATKDIGLLEDSMAAAGFLRDANGGPRRFTQARQVFDAAADGDTQALAALEREGRRIGAALITVAALFDPEIVVVTGGLGQNLEMMRHTVERTVHALSPLTPTILSSTLGDSAVLYGAIARAVPAAQDRLFIERSR